MHVFKTFQTYPDPLESGNWMTVTDGVIGKYCQQSNPGLVLSNQPNDKMVVTKDLDLAEGHVIQFKVRLTLLSINYIDIGGLFVTYYCTHPQMDFQDLPVVTVWGSSLFCLSWLSMFLTEMSPFFILVLLGLFNFKN